MASTKYQSNPFLATTSGLVEILKTNPIPAMALVLVLCLGYLGSLIVGGILAAILPVIGAILMFVVVLAFIAVAIGASSALAVNSFNGKSKKTMELVSESYPKILPVLGAAFLIWLVVVVGLFLFVIPGIIFGTWFSLTFIAMFDENLGVIDSMKRSKQLVSGHFMEVFSALIASTLMSGGLLSLATAVAPMAGRYYQLKTLKASDTPAPKVHWLNYVLPILVFAAVGLYVLLIVVAGVQTGSRSRHTNFNNNSSSSLYNLQ